MSIPLSHLKGTIQYCLKKFIRVIPRSIAINFPIGETHIFSSYETHIYVLFTIVEAQGEEVDRDCKGKTTKGKQRALTVVADLEIRVAVPV